MNNLNITVAYAGPEWSGEIDCPVSAGASIGDAIAASGIGQHISGFPMTTIVCGVWGKVRPIGHVLREGDRVEIYRPLQADPKDARRMKATAKASAIAGKRK